MQLRCCTRDLTLVRSLLAEPRAWDAATDDAAPDRDTWQPNADERIVYLVASDDAGAIAVYTLIPHNSVCYEIHASRVFGRNACAGLRGAIAWAFETTGARRIVASIPATNRIAIRAAERAGMLRYGVNRASFLKHGALLDQVLLGISAI